MGPVVDPETGYIYLRNRYYDPATAQFLTPDPLYAMTGERYGYAGNDPINGSDPTGLWCLVHNSSGGCKGSGVVHKTVSYAKSWVPNCVTVGNSNCTSLATIHPRATKTLGVVAGVAAAATGVGALGETGLLAIGLGATSVAAGGAAAALDYGPCMHDHDTAACVGLIGGGAGAVIGFGTLLIPEATLSSAALWAIASQGFIAGGIGSLFDLTDLFSPSTFESQCNH